MAKTVVEPRLNAMTLDVEDYFHVSAFESVIAPSDWDSLALRVENSTNRLIDLFNAHEVKATFFTLGWVAKRCPKLMQRIVADGHELASHGLNHRRATQMDEAAFTADVSESLKILQDAGGVDIIGYRAPSFSINDNNTWVYSILTDLGFKYSSSTYPISHDLYGVPHWPRFKYQRPEGIFEIPVPTLLNGKKPVGIGGGGYFRLYPYWLSKKRISRFLAEESQPYNFYFHPWEVDPDQPRVADAPLKSRLRHYINLSKMEAKLRQLLTDFRWSSMQDVYGFFSNNAPKG